MNDVNLVKRFWRNEEGPVYIPAFSLLQKLYLLFGGKNQMPAMNSACFNLDVFPNKFSGKNGRKSSVDDWVRLRKVVSVVF